MNGRERHGIASARAQPFQEAHHAVCLCMNLMWHKMNQLFAKRTKVFCGRSIFELWLFLRRFRDSLCGFEDEHDNVLEHGNPLMRRYERAGS